MPTQDEVPHRRVAGRYRLDRILGGGAVGAVWAAYDEVLGRPVAIKEILPPAGMPDAEADALRERTLREARAIAVVSHPNVVTLYDVVRDEGEPFVVLELVAARSLSEVLTDGPLTPSRAASVGAAVAAALAAAHAAGITHRDVKPGNVLVSEDGLVKLTDFGIARNPADSTLTGSGLLLGSPAFMAPEVASGAPVSPAADLWSLGATLFAAVEGHPPYDVGGDPVETVSAVIHSAVPVPVRPGPLGDVIRGLMVKDPGQRMPLASVHELLHPISDQRAGVPFPSVPADPPAPSRTGTGRASPAGSRPDAQRPGGAAPLADDPGPLPWQTAPSRPAPSGAGTRRWSARRRRALRTPLRYTLVALVLIASAASAFGLTRMAVGLSLLPEPPSAGAAAASSAAPAPPQPPPTLATREVVLDGSGARFSLAVPIGWALFRQRTDVGEFSGRAVSFVSDDGSKALTVTRVRDFLPQGDPGEYLDQYLAGVAGAVDGLFQVARQTGEDTGTAVTYRTVQGTGDQALLRTSYLRLRPDDSELWMLRVTVPTKSEQAGRTEIFDRVVPTFDPVT